MCIETDICVSLKMLLSIAVYEHNHKITALQKMDKHGMYRVQNHHPVIRFGYHKHLHYNLLI